MVARLHKPNGGKTHSMLALHVTLVLGDLAAWCVRLGAGGVDHNTKPHSSISCRRQASGGSKMPLSGRSSVQIPRHVVLQKTFEAA